MKKPQPVRGPFIHVPVTNDLKRRLDKRGKEEDRSLSAVVRRAIEAYLDRPVSP